MTEAKVLKPDTPVDIEVPWPSHPFGINLVKSLFAHYEKIGDVQTLAMISCALGNKKIDLPQLSRKNTQPSTKIYDDSLLAPSPLYNQYRKYYAELLYRWGEQQKSCEILKYLDTHKEKHKGIDFIIKCSSCKGSLQTGGYCPTCKSHGFLCSLCNLPVKGLSSFCMLCYHGGHTQHLQKWFKDHKVCPTGCGCACSDQLLSYA